MSQTNRKRLRAVAYCRTSGEGQRDNTSIGTQMDQIKSFCDQNEWHLGRCYIDQCKTGSKIAGRDEFQRMMKDAANGRFDIVVAFDISRFARDGFDILGSSQSLKRDFEVDVVDTKGQYDTRDHRKVLQNFLFAGVSEHERLSIMERTQGGRIARAREGKPWSGSPPVGRAWDKERQAWYVDDKGHRLAEMLQRYLDGEGTAALGREYGFRADKVSGWVHHGQLSGDYKAHFHCPDLGIKLDVPVPGMPEVVSNSLLKKVKARLYHNQRNSRTDIKSYLLSGFIRCELCGLALSGQTSTRTKYYRHVGCECKFTSVRADQVEPTVLDFLYGSFLDKPTFEEALKRALPSDEDRKVLEKDHSRTEKKLVKNKVETGRLVDAIAKGVDANLLISKQEELKAEREALVKRLQELSEEIAAQPDVEHARAVASDIRTLLYLEHGEKDWRKLSYEEIKRFLLFLFGEKTRKSTQGIFVSKDENGSVLITFRGHVDFHHILANGRPMSDTFILDSNRINAKIQKDFEREVARIGVKYKTESEESKPFVVKLAGVKALHASPFVFSIVVQRAA